MNKNFYMLVVMVIAAFSFGCQPETEELNPEIIDALGKRAPSQFQTDNYIVVSHDETVPEGLVKKLESAGGIVSNSFPEMGLVAVTATNKSFASKVNRMSEVRYLVPDLKLQWIEPGKNIDFKNDLANPPFADDEDDRLYNLQWGLAAMDVPKAWSLSNSKGAGVTVAVLDGGYYLNHPDLSTNIIGGINLVPDESLQFIPYYDEEGNFISFSHGTHVAGTIAAPDNGLGVIGVAPEAKLYLVKVLSDQGSGDFSGIINGIYIAALVGNADVINMSLGASIPQGLGPDSKFVAALRVAMDRAVDFATKQGATVITSAGNSARDAEKDKSMIVFPASSPKALSISATAPEGWLLNPFTNLDILASYSNYGTSLIDFAAPGGDFDFQGSLPSGFPIYAYDMVISTSSYDESSNTAFYGWSAGTSMASPHAAGVAALIIGKNGGEMDPAKVISILKQSADDLGKPGKDDAYGYGRINAYKALMQ